MQNLRSILDALPAVDEEITPEQMTKRITAYYAAQGKYCESCRGSGYMSVKIPYTVRRISGSALAGSNTIWAAAPCSECNGKRESASSALSRRLSYTGAPANLLASCTFERFCPDAAQAGILRQVRAWADRPAGSLVFMGGFGTGKTHLAIAALRVLTANGLRVRFGHLRDDIISSLRRAMDDGTYEQVWAEWVEHPDVLIIDDYGTEQGTDWQHTITEQAITYRYARDRLFIVTSNLGPGNMSELIRSRMNDHSRITVLDFGVGDYRPKLPALH